MKLIRNVAPYVEAVKGFVQGRYGADEFLPRFSHLWRCDDSGSVSTAESSASMPMTHTEAGLYGVLDQINALCETYERCLPPGCGYRVSEEQLRKEIQRIASTNPLLDPGAR